MPRPGTRLIPDQWEAHHRPTADGQMTGECEITRPSDQGTFDESAGRTVYPLPAVLYAGPMRLQALAQADATPQVGDAQATLRRYRASLPACETGFRVNDQLRVTGLTDTGMVGRVLRIVDVPSGSLLWQRDLICEDTTPATR
jgi:hypothetical protein